MPGENGRNPLPHSYNPEKKKKLVIYFVALRSWVSSLIKYKQNYYV